MRWSGPAALRATFRSRGSAPWQSRVCLGPSHPAPATGSPFSLSALSGRGEGGGVQSTKGWEASEGGVAPATGSPSPSPAGPATQNAFSPARLDRFPPPDGPGSPQRLPGTSGVGRGVGGPSFALLHVPYPRERGTTPLDSFFLTIKLTVKRSFLNNLFQTGCCFCAVLSTEGRVVGPSWEHLKPKGPKGWDPNRVTLYLLYTSLCMES